MDVPGYGYAKMSKQQLIRMGQMMDDYFSKREQIACVVQLIDARHEPTRDDLDMIAYLKDLGLDILIVATKIDKVPKTKRIRALKTISQSLQISLKNIYPVSSTERTGFEPIYEIIESKVKNGE